MQRVKAEGSDAQRTTIHLCFLTDPRRKIRMSHIVIPALNDAPTASRPVLNAVTERLGFTPNIFLLMSISPAVLNGFIGLQGPLNKTLDLMTRDAIALVVSEVNGCSYCLAALGHGASSFSKTSLEEIAQNGEGESAKAAAAARFAAKVVENRGHVTNADLAAVREVGFTDGQILEIVALSVQFLFTNFMNNVSGTEIDFPLIDLAVAI
jgi:uncharacterized peroxidase-related enzyme